MRWQDHIEQRPEVMVGKPVIRGTRITVEFILERLGAGTTTDDLLASYPHIRPEHIQAAQAFAARAVRSKWARARRRTLNRATATQPAAGQPAVA